MFSVVTEPTGWSYILGPDGYREGPIRYRWEAEEWAAEMNAGKPPPREELHKLPPTPPS